jgi:hypothetical protein
VKKGMDMVPWKWKAKVKTEYPNVPDFFVVDEFLFHWRDDTLYSIAYKEDD